MFARDRLAVALVVLLVGAVLSLRAVDRVDPTKRNSRGGQTLARNRREASPARLELAWNLASARAGDRLFATALDTLVARLRAARITIGHVAPQTRAALVAAPGLDEERLAAALNGLPLVREGAIDDGRVHLKLDEQASAPVEEAARQAVLAIARARIVAAGLPLDGTTQVTLAADELVARVPILDDAGARWLQRIVESVGELELRPLAADGGAIDSRIHLSGGGADLALVAGEDLEVHVLLDRAAVERARTASPMASFGVFVDGKLASAPIAAAHLAQPIALGVSSFVDPVATRGIDSAERERLALRALRIVLSTGALPVPLSLARKRQVSLSAWGPGQSAP